MTGRSGPQGGEDERKKEVGVTAVLRSISIRGAIAVESSLLTVEHVTPNRSIIFDVAAKSL